MNRIAKSNGAEKRNGDAEQAVDMTERNRIVLELTASARNFVDELLTTGLYGSTKEEVVLTIFTAEQRRIIASGEISEIRKMRRLIGVHRKPSK